MADINLVPTQEIIVGRPYVINDNGATYRKILVITGEWIDNKRREVENEITMWSTVNDPDGSVDVVFCDHDNPNSWKHERDSIRERNKRNIAKDAKNEPEPKTLAVH
jgi:hypothetical protein